MINKIKSFLLENKGTKQILLKNTFWISFSDVSGKLLRTILLIYIARYLGATDYGRFTFAFANISIFVSFLDLGLSSIITRELARSQEKESDIFALLTLKIILGLATCILIYIFSYYITNDPEIRGTIWILAGFSFVSQFPEILYAFLRARQRMEFEALANIAQISLMVVLVLFVIFNFPSIRSISYSYLLSSVITMIPLLLFFNYKIYPVRLAVDTVIWKKYLVKSWPLALTSLFGMLYSYIDSIMMGHMGFMQQTGWYNAALKIVYVLSAPASIIAASFYPVLSRYVGESKNRIQGIWDFQSEILIFMVLPIICGGFIIAPEIIATIYGPSFMPAVNVFRILLIMISIVFFTTPFSNMLIAANHQKKLFWVTICGAGANISLNFFLIPHYNLYGAAFASIITYILIFLLYFVFIKRYVHVTPLNLKTLKSIIKATIPCALMCILLLLLINKLNIFILITISSFLYIVIAYRIRKFDFWGGGSKSEV